MCGLCVVVSADFSPSTFCAALDTMRHRGPNETQVEYGTGWAFGFQRLAVVDVDGSRQPLRYPPDGPDRHRWTVVCNGEIYNYRELRGQLIDQHGATFATDGDAEVLAATYHYWGAAALPRLRGMFAFVAWDSLTGTLHAARDAFGIKPLYLLERPGALHLASEKKALVPFTSQALDHDALAHYFTMQYVPEPATLHRGIRRLAPGHRLTWQPGSEVHIDRWFQTRLAPAAWRPEKAFEAIRDALRDSVRAHLHADVPVGAFLSSGVDSTAVVALAREVDPDIHAFTAGFGEAGYSEIEVAEDTARQLGVRLTPTVVTDADVLRELPRIAWHLDDPVADPSLIPLWFLARTASRHVTVVLSGEGADELFGGYRIYREPASLAPLEGLPDPMKRGLRALSDVMPEGVRGQSYLRRGTTPIEERYYGNARTFSPAEKRELLRFVAAPHTVVTAPLYAAATELDDVGTMQFIDLNTWLPGDILTKADRMSMAHSLELRVPFLDPAVYEVARSLPTSLKLPRGSRTTKWALRQAMAGIVPDSIVDRPKLGFPTPTRRWLRGEIGDWADDLMARSQTGDLIDLGYARRLLAAHRADPRVDNSRKVWTVVMFCLWYEVTMESPAAARVVTQRREVQVAR
jgi:asparagine synthase (glutamine-hydrolysing)